MPAVPGPRVTGETHDSRGRIAMKARGLSTLCITVALFGAQPLPAQDAAEREAPGHLDCAAGYAAVSLALPYLPGIFLMFSIAPRSGHAQSAYIREANPVSPRAVRLEAERRKSEIMAAFEAGDVTLDELIARARACDRQYGFEPIPATLDDILRPE